LRFIGNKERLVDWIFSIIQKHNIKGKVFFDFFSGTSNVGKFFKQKDYQIISSDLLYFSYVLQRAYIQNNDIPKFEKLLKNITIKSNLFMSCLFQRYIWYFIKSKQILVLQLLPYSFLL